jgi:hypothetical protein
VAQNRQPRACRRAASASSAAATDERRNAQPGRQQRPLRVGDAAQPPARQHRASAFVSSGCCRRAGVPARARPPHAADLVPLACLHSLPRQQRDEGAPRPARGRCKRAASLIAGAPRRQPFPRSQRRTDAAWTQDTKQSMNYNELQRQPHFTVRCNSCFVLRNGADPSRGSRGFGGSGHGGAGGARTQDTHHTRNCLCRSRCNHTQRVECRCDGFSHIGLASTAHVLWQERQKHEDGPRVQRTRSPTDAPPYILHHARLDDATADDFRAAGGWL